MLDFLPIDLAGQRPPQERTAAINAAVATLQPAKPKHARSTTRNPNERLVRQLVASFKPPPREPIPPLHGLDIEDAPRRSGLRGEVGRGPPILASA